MKLLITESQLKVILNESPKCVGLNCDDVVKNYDDIDLQNEYKKLNKILYNNTLPIINIKFGGSSKNHGLFVHSEDNMRLENPYIILTKYYLNTYGQLLGTLAHEMIHFYQFYNKIEEENGNHGPVFMKEMIRINKIAKQKNLGFVVDIEGTDDDIKKIHPQFIKPRVYVMVQYDNNPLQITPLISATYERIKNGIKKVLKKESKNHNEINVDVYKIRNEKLFRRLPTYRDFDKYFYDYDIDKKLLNTIKTKGEKIEHYIIKNSEINTH